MASEFPPEMKQLTGNNLRFALNLLQKEGNLSDNILISPFSIGVTLSMVFAGAKSHTAKEMKNVLQLESFEDDADIHWTFDQVIETIQEQNGKGVNVLTANRMYLQNGMDLTDSFLITLENSYHSDVAIVEFDTKYDSVRGEINEWVEGITNHKIKDLIADGVLNALTRLVLVNAVYFKGNWAEQFDAKETTQSAFHLDQSKEILVDMMHMKKDLNFGSSENLNCNILELPYENKNLSMYVILPAEIEGLMKLELQLDSQSLSDLIESMRIREVVVAMPKFKMESSISLSTILSGMGMESLFIENRADLSGMCSSERLHVSAVIHKTFVEVNEEGTEAAAATAAVMMLCCFIPPQEFTVDHPFIFLIREKASGIVLFLGRMTNPMST